MFSMICWTWALSSVSSESADGADSDAEAVNGLLVEFESQGAQWLLFTREPGSLRSSSMSRSFAVC